MATSDTSKQNPKASLKQRLIDPFRSSKSKLKSGSSSTVVDVDKVNGLPLFQYSALDSTKKSVRLLEIFPGPDFEPIEGKLSHCDLDDSPSYIALSYMWDQGGQEKCIVCQGTRIRVGENLWYFLHRYRQKMSIQHYREKNPSGSIKLWIDAVCINQKENAERSHQVSLMRDIYSGADSVIVWLGLVRKTEELAFLLTRHPELLKVDEMSAALIDLLNKPYWSRVWVVQEFVLAKDVEIWCGEFQASAADFESLWRDDRPSLGHSSSQHILNSRGWTLFKHRRDFRHSRKYKRELLGRRNSRTLKATFRLRDLLQSFSSSQSSEVYDKIYGFLGIASTGRGERIRPDYSKAPVELLVDVIRNQCDDKTARGSEDNYHFVMFLMRMLKVTRMQFARHVLQCCPELEQFIYVLAISDFMMASVSLIGTIVNAGSSVHRAEAFQENMWSSGSLSRSPMHPGDLSTSDIRDLGSLASFPETRLAFEFEDYHIANAVYRGKSENLRQRSVEKSTEAVIQGLLHDRDDDKGLDLPTHAATSLPSSQSALKEKGKEPQRNRKDLQQIFLRSFSDGAALVSRARREQSEWDTQARYEQYTTFIGTNSIIGIICTSDSPDAPQVMPGDHISVFSDDTISKNALILRHDEIEGRWAIIGFAVIITSVSNAEPRGMVHSLQQAFGKTVQQTRNDFDIDEKAIGPLLRKQLCFHCHLTDLLELSRCGTLSDTQLKRLLEQSLRDGDEDETHQCSLGLGQHEILEFEL